MRNHIATTDAPAAIGPYSQAVCVGDFVFISGQIPLDPATNTITAPDIAAQTAQCLRNIAAILKAQGMALHDVVKTTVFLQDLTDFAAMNEVYASFFPVPAPARAAVQVAALPRQALVEIEAIAHREDIYTY